MNLTFAADEQAMGVAYSALCNNCVRTSTWQLMCHNIHYKNPMPLAAATFTLAAPTEADRTMALPCDACPGSLFE